MSLNVKSIEAKEAIEVLQSLKYWLFFHIYMLFFMYMEIIREKISVNLHNKKQEGCGEIKSQGLIHFPSEWIK